MHKVPDFVFIGPDKTGSSWMYKLLASHRECYVPKIKDLYYFDRFFSRGDDWYLSHFPAITDCSAIGELSHDYLYSSEACERIHAFNPQMKIITCLRDPVERSFSHYLYIVRSGLTRKPVLEAIDSFPEIIENSRYHKYLPAYLEAFGFSQVKVLFFEDLKADTRKFADDLLGFLDLKTGIELPPKERSAANARSHFLARLVKEGAHIFRKIRGETLVGLIKESTVCRLLYRQYEPEERPVMTLEERSVLHGLLCDVHMHTENVLGVKISNWNL